MLVINFQLVPFTLKSSLKTEILAGRQCIEAVAWRYSLKKVYLEISPNSQENTCTRVSFFNKVTPPVAAYKCTFYCKRINSAQMCISYCKILFRLVGEGYYFETCTSFPNHLYTPIHTKYCTKFPQNWAR